MLIVKTCYADANYSNQPNKQLDVSQEILDCTSKAHSDERKQSVCDGIASQTAKE